MNRLEDFLINCNFAKKTIQDKKARLTFAFNFFRSINTSENFLEIKSSEFLDFFKHVDKTIEAQDLGKKRYRYALKNFSDFLCKNLYAQDLKPPLNYDFIFSNRFYEFRDDSIPREHHFVEKSDIIELKKWARHTQHPKVYYAICLQITTGMRVGDWRKTRGLLSITRDNLDFDNRIITVKSKKTTTHKSGIVIYVIAKPLLTPLKNYIDYLPHSQTRIFPISPQRYNERLKEWKPWMHNHLLRDALNTMRFEMGLEESLRCILLNQNPKGVNASYYLRKYNDIKKRVELYDKFYPFRNLRF